MRAMQSHGVESMCHRLVSLTKLDNVQAFKISTSSVLIPAAIAGMIKKFIINKLLFRYTIKKGAAKGIKPVITLPSGKEDPASIEENFQTRLKQFDDFESFGGWKPKSAADAAFLGRFGGFITDSHENALYFSAWLLVVLFLQAVFIKNLANPVENAVVALFSNVVCHVVLS